MTDGKEYHLLRSVVVFNILRAWFFNGNIVSNLSVGDA